ncbi:PDZ domain-containing protein [Nakamurella silvestris]|nr:PDZ domain-containing protein [Nakamurella silvestris]
MSQPLPDRPVRLTTKILVAAGVAIALIAGVAGGLLVHLTRTQAVPAAPVGGCDTVSLADKVLPSVVTINVVNGSSASNGSGAFIRDSGYIVTNDHVVSPGVNGGTFTVLMSSGETEPATLIGRATLLDLAVLRIEHPEKAPAIGIATEPVVVGQPVVALGSPLGLSGSVTSGIVSALGREIRVPADEGKTALIDGAIQTDASINPGNSGGALVDCQGRLVGINTAIATVPNAAGEAGGGSVGIGFAIPVDLAAAVTDELIATGKFAIPTFGWSVAPISPQIAAEFNLPAGLFVRSVAPEGAAALAGIEPGDVVTKVNGQAVADDVALTRIALGREIGDQVQVDYHRNGQDFQTQLALK